MTALRLPTFIIAVTPDGTLKAREVPADMAPSQAAERAMASGQFREVYAATSFQRIAGGD